MAEMKFFHAYLNCKAISTLREVKQSDIGVQRMEPSFLKSWNKVRLYTQDEFYLSLGEQI